MQRSQLSGVRERLFTSESVSEGHPDKMCDQISDAILDACLVQDRLARVACEVFATTDRLVIGGEITTTAVVDIDAIARRVVHDIGYTQPGLGFDCSTVEITNLVKNQSPDIAMGVDESEGKPQGAGDQGMMFGYACDETSEYMPAPIMFSHRLLKAASVLRRGKKLPWLRPDAKAQVTVRYQGETPVAIDTVVLSHQHEPSVSNEEIRKALLEQIIMPVLDPTGLFTQQTRCIVNPTGRFVIGGPMGDTGLTGRKIIVDTYGGMGRHGGGAFSGKDPSKVDRSAAYMARWIARTLVNQHLCTRCEIQISYAIGVAEPVSVLVDTFGTGIMDDSKMEALVFNTFDLTPAGIIKSLDLLRPIYLQTASYGHFGKPELPWESNLPSLV